VSVHECVIRHQSRLSKSCMRVAKGTQLRSSMPKTVVSRRPHPTPPQLLFLGLPPLLVLIILSGSHTAGPGCCKCPIHCKLPDGTFRVVRARDTDAAANVGTAATAPTSLESRHALRIYNAAVDDFDTPAADIAFLRSIYETERQAK